MKVPGPEFDQLCYHYRGLTDILLVAATQAREGLGEDLGPLSLATALVPARILQRATISSRGRCWSGTFKSTRINRGGSDDGTGARAYSHWPADPATERRFNACLDERWPLAALESSVNFKDDAARRTERWQQALKILLVDASACSISGV